MQPIDEIEMKLWDYLDNRCSDAERAQIALLIETDATWKTMYTELLATNTLLQSTEVEHPSMRFSKNVMDTIAATSIAPRTNKYLNHRIIKGTVALFIMCMAGFLVYIIAVTDWASAAPLKRTVLINNWFSNPATQHITMYVFIIVALLFVDSLLRRNNHRNKNATL